jgi:hypothetical protein
MVFIDLLKAKFKKDTGGAASSLTFLNRPRCGWQYSTPNPRNYYPKDVMMNVPHKLFPGIVMICGRVQENGQSCTGHLTPKQWHRHVRYIHGLNNGIYLVQYEYKCQVCDASPRSSADIIDDPKSKVPEIVKLVLGEGASRLTKRSGVDTDLRDFIINTIITKSTFDDIATAVKMRRHDEYMRKRTHYYADVANHNQNPEVFQEPRTWLPFSPLDDPHGYNEKPGIGEDYIRDVFVGTYCCLLKSNITSRITSRFFSFLCCYFACC